MNETILTLESLINRTGGIPLTITTTTQTAPWQFYITLIMGSIGVLYCLVMVFGEKIKVAMAKAYLMAFKMCNKTNSLMIIKHTQQDLFSSSMINRRTLEKVQEALTKFEGKDFNLILYTPGGEIFSAMYISRLLKKYEGNIKSFIPTFAMSGGTLLALSTDEIFMNEYSCLGPVDPQLGSLFKFGSAKAWKEIVKFKGKKAEDSSISMKMMGEQYTKSIKENISELIGSKMNNKDKKELVKLLVSGDVEHGMNITKEMLQSIGLKIGEIQPKMSTKLNKLVKSIPDGVSFIK